MTHYPGSIARPVPSHGGPASSHMGPVMHVTTNWFDPYGFFSNPANQASSNWWTSAQGVTEEYVDADLRAWAQANGNGDWASWETSGTPDVPLSEAQLNEGAKLYAWGHNTYGWPLQLSDSPTVPGFGWHGMGGQAWGGHFSCLPLDITEVLTPNGWIGLSDVTNQTYVASWNTDSQLITFAHPLGIIPSYDADTISVGDVEMTPDHRMWVYRNDCSAPAKFLTAAELAAVRTNWSIPTCGVLPTTGMGVGADLMRLLTWVQADGHYLRGKTGKVEALDFHLSKLRKIDRIGAVLNALGKEYTLNRRSDGTHALRVYGQQWIIDNVLRYLPEKTWTWDLLQADDAEFKALDEEITLADGNESGGQRIYFSTPRINVDIIQALYVTHGKSAAIYDSGNGSFAVGLHAKRHTGRNVRDSDKRGRQNVSVSCLTTVDGTILVRQLGHVRVVGNCPGDIRKAQRPEILRRTVLILNPRPPAPPAPAPIPEDDLMFIFNVGLAQYLAIGGKVVHIATPADVKACMAAGAKLVNLPLAVAKALIA